MRKYSKQRELILESLKNRKDHPTAERLYQDLKKQMPNIGIATVYRNLLDLCENSEIIKIKALDGIDRYDGNLDYHIHFECKKCHKISDIFVEKQTENMILNNIKDEEKITIDSMQISTYGICNECR